ncbi:MAG TPA: hypothetical protein VGJ37_14410 [Pyrinomonadaceae bacterium]
MSWNRILLPLKTETCPDTVEIGNLGWEVYRREKEPAGFAMFHATILSEDGQDDKRVVYLSPVASQLCENIAEKYSLEPCKTPARDEPNIAFVFGDPLMMGQLRDSVSTDALVVT